MTLKLKHTALAAALALGFAGSANAAMQISTSGNGSLVMFAEGNTLSAVFDLGVLMDDFLPGLGVTNTLGTTITWNFQTNTVTETTPGGSYAGALSGSWSTAWNAFASQAAGSTYGVIALDSTGAAIGNDRYLSTSRDNAAQTGATSNVNLVAFNGVDAYLNAHNLKATHTGANDGASTADASETAPPAWHDAGFGAGDNWRTRASFNASQFAGTPVDFYFLTTTPGGGTALIGNNGGLTGYAGDFLFDPNAGTLTYMVPIPEPGTWALLLSGLGIVGLIARRRLSA